MTDPRTRSIPLVLTDCATIAAVAVVLLVMLVANPGYFSHDELQKLDHVTRHGMWDYVKVYVSLPSTASFGAPVRPLCFLIQGLLAPLMERFPVAVHLSSVLVHALNACLLMQVCRVLGTGRMYALTAALIFVVNPMTVLAVGWTAALMDQWYVLFGLLAMTCATRFVNRESGPLSLLGTGLAACLSLLSKETAIILPGLMLLVVAVHPASMRSRRFWAACAAWTLPVVAYLVYRLPSLRGSIAGAGAASYVPSISNVLDNLWIYFDYPFLTGLSEAVTWSTLSQGAVWLALAMHLLLLSCLAVRFGIRLAALYVASYFLFLLPVLPIPIHAAHYLYGPALIQSCAIAALLAQTTSQGKLSRSLMQGVGGVLLAVMAVHSFTVQVFVYDLGSCMNRAMLSTAAAAQSAGYPPAIDFQAAPGAPEHILRRFTTGRDQIGTHYPVHFTVSPFGTRAPTSALELVMQPDCLVAPPEKEERQR